MAHNDDSSLANLPDINLRGEGKGEGERYINGDSQPSLTMPVRKKGEGSGGVHST